MKFRKNTFFRGILAIGLALSMSFLSFANTDNMWELNVKDAVVTENRRTNDVSKITGTTRGMLISSVGVGLENQGLGVGEIYGEVLCHEAMSSIRMALILQRWDEENQSWVLVNRQEFNWNASDLPEGEELSMATVSYKIAGLDGTYRVRGLFGAYDLEGTYNEAWNAYTEGVDF